MMKVQLSDHWRILLAGALIAATSGFVVSQVSQWRFDQQLAYMEKQHDKRIAAIKSHHTKEINQLKRTSSQLDSIEKKIDKLNETKGNQ